tara:strand:- start:248 stop:1540 length:1293 start_codon:yes stop_codon:yes gene_type:complete
MKKSLNIVIAGLGTVGSSTINLIERNQKLLLLRSGLKVNIVGIFAKKKNKKRNFNIHKYPWFNNPTTMIKQKNVDVVIELIGGDKGIARKICFESLKNSKNLITANKVLIASKGLELAKLAETNNVSIGYEASVAGGVPIISTLKESLVSVKIRKIIGILNGTCNYMLTDMMEQNNDFKTALKNSQKLGYAEKFPNNDINGLDTLHKISILCIIAFGIKVDYKKIPFLGIQGITKEDILFVNKLGYKIKLLGVCYSKDNNLQLTVSPFLVSKKKELSSINKNLNAIIIETTTGNKNILVGEGAGGDPTAVSVVSDIINLSNSKKQKYVFGLPYNKIKKMEISNKFDSKSLFYIRVLVVDKPGVIAAITSILRDNKISIKSLFQKQVNTKYFNVVILTQNIDKKSILKASVKLNKCNFLKKPIKFLQVLHI